MRAKPSVIDAEFEIVQDSQPLRKRTWQAKAGAWLLVCAIRTAVAGAAALVVGWIGLFVLNLPPERLWMVGVALLVALSAARGLARSPRR